MACRSASPAFGRTGKTRFGRMDSDVAIITTDSNELVTEIHDRMPVILARADYARWLGEELDPRDLMRPFPTHLMRMRPVATRVNRPDNNDPSLIEPVGARTD